ncbi:MAG: InlB B-repeat-containing protein [Clostridia bacterium]|nr:InlB B-repeat-containing protein [Clostridia bacterium]
MKKRILSIILSIVMLVGLLPTTALALPSHSHCVCGGSVTVGGHTHENITSWVAWDGTDADANTADIQLPGTNVYLTNNVSLNDDIAITGAVNFCLNGYKIESSASVFSLVNGAALSICDCSANKTGELSGVVYLYSSSTVNLYSGTITSTSYGIHSNGNNSIVNVYDGVITAANNGIYNYGKNSVNIYGGTITTTGSSLDAVCNTDGTVTVSGGTINAGNEGICNYTGTVTISAGSISGQYGINNNQGTVTISDVATVSGTTSGILNSKTLIVSGGTVSGGSYGIQNYSVYNNADKIGTVELSGAPVITGTMADIYLVNNKVINISGALTYGAANAISVKMDSVGTFTTGWTTKMGDAAYSSYFTSAMGSYTVQKNNSGELKLAKPPATIPVTGVELSESSLILDVGDSETLTATVSPNNATNKAVTWGSNNESVATVANGVVTAVSEGTATITVTTADGSFTATCTVKVVPVHEHHNCGVANCTNATHNHSEVNEWIKLTKENIGSYVTKSSSSYILTPGSYYLGEDITLSDVANDCTFIYMNASGTYNVCLNGNTITGSGSAQVFRANDTNAVLSICDCSEPSTGKITGGKNGGVYIDDGTVNLYGGSITGNTVYQQGAGVYVSSGTFNMYGGSISNNTFTSSSDRKGGGVYVSSGTFNMYGGTISDHVSSNGGGVYVASGTFNMSGTAAISGNSASSQGGGVYVYSGTFTMTGGKITGNNANNNSGGVHNRGGTFNVSGSPVVTDNTVGTAENNIYCANDITIIGALTADAQIGVNYSSERIFTSGWTAAMGESETDYEKYFTSDNSGFEIVKNDSGELELKKPTIPVTDVVLDKSSITLDVNGTAELAATVLPDDATDKTVSWTSSDPTVAKVENGKVTAKKPGTATITVTTNDGSFTDTCTVTVNKIAITGTIVVTTVTEPKVGETYSPNVNVSTDLTTGYYSMSASDFSPSASSDPVKAGTAYTLSVTFQPSSGYFFGENIQATFNGEAVEITRLDIGGTIYLQIEHTYSFPAAVPNSVDILRNGAPADTASILLPGINENAATMDFTAKTLDQYGQEMTGQTVAWSITGTDTTGISVTGGVLTVTKDAAVGNYTLTATCDGKSDSITIKVEKAESVLTTVKIFDGGGAGNEITTIDRTIPNVGSTLYINSAAKGYDQYGELMIGLTFTWSNTNTDSEISLVDGHVTIGSGAHEGNFTYTASCNGKSATVTVNLTKKIYTVTYTDNVANETVFADVSETVQSGGTAPAYPNGTPSRTGYTFDGWYTSTDGGATLSASAYDFDTPVTGNLTLYAKWTRQVYTIKFVDEDGTELQSSEVAYGETPVYNGSTPTKAATAQYTYTFAGWTPEIAAVTGEATYTATYTSTVNKYTIKFVDEDGTELQSGEVAYGETPVYNGSTPTKAATAQYTYTFAGWTPEIAAVTGEATYTATYTSTVNEYTVIFADWNGTELDRQTVAYGNAATTPTAPTRTGHTFTGWDKAFDEIVADLTVTAQYRINQYTITFDTNGGSAVDSITQDYNTDVTAPADPTKIGYDFGGWLKDGDDFTFNSYKMGAENFTLIAKWNPANGTAYMVNHHFQNVENDEYTVEPETKHGYTDSDTAAESKSITGFTAGVVTQKKIAPDGTTVIDIYYTRNVHTLTFKPENGEENIVSEVKFGAAITTPDAPAKTGYTFKGWGEVAATMPDADVTYTAGWTINQYTITFNSNGGSAVPEITQDYNTAVVQPENPTKTGYDFGGWYEDAELTTAYVFSTMPAENITVYAKWNPANGIAYTVKHYHEDVSGDGYTLYETETLRGTTNAQTAAEAKNYPGFTAQTFEQTTILPDGSAVVEIKYDRNIYSVTLVTNGGTVRDGDITEYTYGVGAKLPTDVTRSGYRFGGWYDNEACKGTPVTEITATDIGDKTFYAKWEYIYIPIITPTYDVEIADDITGGDVSASKKLAYRGDTITITVVPDAGYELTKLTVTDSRGNAVSVTKVTDIKYTFKMPGYDVEIDAVFAKIDTTCPRDWTCPMYGYTDLDRTLWYHDGIHYCIEHGLMVGTGTNIFEPNIATSRAMIVTILWRLEGSPVVNYAMDFEDVAAGQWYTEAIRWAASEKIVEGYGNGKFGANDAITREQMVTIMWRYAKYKGYDVSVGENTNILSYDDAFDVADWAIPAMQWACGESLVQGIADGSKMNLAPQGNATRAQAAAILQRFIENVVNGK